MLYINTTCTMKCENLSIYRHSILDCIVPLWLFRVLSLYNYYTTLSGRPGGYPDDDLINKKKQKKHEYEN